MRSPVLSDERSAAEVLSLWLVFHANLVPAAHRLIRKPCLDWRQLAASPLEQGSVQFRPTTAHPAAARGAVQETQIELADDHLVTRSPRLADDPAVTVDQHRVAGPHLAGVLP